MKLQRVVIGIDFSEPSVAAARWAARHFASGAELVLVHSIDIPQPPRFLRGRFPPRDALVETAREGADKRLHELSETLAAERIWLRVHVGYAAEQIAMAASDFDADLVVVGRHGERPGVWNRLGSTAERLVRCSPAPVLLATGMRDKRPRKLLVPVDDASVTRWLLAWARFLAERFNAETTALHVVSSAVLSHVLSMAAVGAGGAEADEVTVREEFRGDTDRWLERLVATGFDPARVRSEVTFGHAAHEILGAAHRLRTDLIVMGSRGRGGIRRAVLGSVAGEVLRHATCSVLVVKEPEDELVGDDVPA